MLLIHPPVVKPSEPPPGIARLSGALAANGIQHHVIDANIEGLNYLLNKAVCGSIGHDTWTNRALRNLSNNLDTLKNPESFKNIDRYKRAVTDINRILEMFGGDKRTRISLVDYRHTTLSPLRSDDLLYAADHPEENPFYPYLMERLSDAVGQNNNAFVGISLNYLSQALTSFAIIGLIRKRFPSIKIIAGGGLITSWMRNASWQNPFEGLIDHLVAGPGEAHLLAILGHKNKTETYSPPNYDSLCGNSYMSPGFIMPYSASSGCYWGKCSFCPERAEDNPYSQTNSDLVTTDLKTLSKKYKPVLIHLTDNAVSPALLKRITNVPPGPPWYGFVRATRHLNDAGFCHALKQAGCIMLKIGLESGSQDVIDSMNKGIDLKMAANILKNIKAAGIATYVYLLFGTPAETESRARETLDFAAEYADCIDFMNIAVFNMPANSPDAKNLTTKAFYEGDLSLYTDFKHTKGWGRRQIRQFLDREFRKHPAIRPIMRRNPPFFTSSHAGLLREKVKSEKS